MTDKQTTGGLNAILLILGIYFIVTGIMLNIPSGQELLSKLLFMPTPIVGPDLVGHYGVFYIVLGILSFQARMVKVWMIARPLVLTLTLGCFVDAAAGLVHMGTFGTYPTISYLLASGGFSVIGLILLTQYMANNK